VWTAPFAARGRILTIKNIVIPLEAEYLDKAAKQRGISRTKLVRMVMETVVREQLVSKIIGDVNLANDEPPPQKYRRFRNRK
jgi:hypothetical protein